MLASYYVASQKTVSKETLHEEHSSETFGLRYPLVVYLMKWNLWNIVKNRQNKDDTFHTKTENFKRVILLLLRKCYLETDWSDVESQCQNSVVVIFQML